MKIRDPILGASKTTRCWRWWRCHDDICLQLRLWRTLLPRRVTPHNQSAQKRRESKSECFVVSLLHFQGRLRKRFYFPEPAAAAALLSSRMRNPFTAAAPQSPPPWARWWWCCRRRRLHPKSSLGQWVTLRPTERKPPRKAAPHHRKRFYFPDRRVDGQDHLVGSNQPDMHSAHMGTWNLVEISRAMLCDPETVPHFETVKGLESWSWKQKTRNHPSTPQQ